MTRLVHAVLAALAAVELVRALHQPWLRAATSDEWLVFGWAIVLPIASAAASVLAIWRGWARGRSERALVADLATYAVALGAGVPARARRTGPERRRTHTSRGRARRAR